MKIIPTICLAAVFASACKPGSPSDEGAVRDSAGVRIVEYNHLESQGATLSMSNEPLFRYGELPGDYQFQMIWRGALQPDGSAIVLDARAQEVLRIDHHGMSHTVIARNGRGPNEVLRVLGIVVLGQDTVLIEDDGNARISIFEGNAVSRSIGLAGDFSITMGLQILGISEAGQLLMSTSAFSPDFTEPWFAGRLVRFDAETGIADTVASFDLARFAPREGPTTPFLPYGQVAAAQGRFVVARTDRPEIKWLSADGVLEQIVRWNPPPVYPTNADWEAFVNGLRMDLRRVNPQMEGAQLQQLINRQVERYELDTGEPMPVFSLLHSDAEGRVWLANFDPVGPLAGVSKYTMIDHTGKWLGVIEPPETFRFLDAGYGRVLGVMKDQNDVQHVVAFGLETGGL